jgi:uncharacterized membrane protein YoaK (UPF0700 family)
MKPAPDSRASYSDAGLASLSFASGCTDVLTFLKLGNVFTSAMTGNTALLAIEIGRGNLAGALRALTALLAFALGVALAAKLNTLWSVPADRLRVFSRLLFLELPFLIACAALWSASPEPPRLGAVYAIILLSAVSMGIQAVAAGSIRSGINTIVFTSVLVRIVMSVATASRPADRAAEPNPNFRAYLGTFAAYGFGALLAAVLVPYLLRLIIWVPIAAVVFAQACAALASRPSGQPRHAS